ncbi:hypothetical protein N7466_006109 [Penicillium verhagenii]|uniref:uncharacterized protein n=1 Tax=Penicillium verhagenii TaxID=1562060 RepID=UPI002545127D|nr:uncharacterized protein N7466_006109 [Penicillium verhagenii]KAJ5930616.1 hypothetical protein N7466_006109 [Penicillium verhagenii]
MSHTPRPPDPQRDIINNVGDWEILVWDELQVPQNMESDAEQWVGDFQPLVEIAGHWKCHWARPRERPDTVLLLTLWPHMSKLREFEDSPDAQIFWENLASKGILRLASHETVYRCNWVHGLDLAFIQLFWVYFPASLDDDQLADIREFRGLHPPAAGFSIPQKDHIVTHSNRKIWAHKTKIVNGQETQLMLWLNFWNGEKKAEWQNIHLAWSSRTIKDRFIRDLESYKPIMWKEEFCIFRRFNGKF